MQSLEQKKECHQNSTATTTQQYRSKHAISRTKAVAAATSSGGHKQRHHCLPSDQAPRRLATQQRPRPAPRSQQRRSTFSGLRSRCLCPSETEQTPEMTCAGGSPSMPRHDDEETVAVKGALGIRVALDLATVKCKYVLQKGVVVTKVIPDGCVKADGGSGSVGQAATGSGRRREVQANRTRVQLRCSRVQPTLLQGVHT